jgi:hypothetical protein
LGRRLGPGELLQLLTEIGGRHENITPPLALDDQQPALHEVEKIVPGRLVRDIVAALMRHDEVSRRRLA